MPRTKYLEIHDELQREIVSGAYSGGMLPTEEQLSQRYGCSRNTVRRAVEQLAQEGYVQTIQGRGSVVLERLPTSSEVQLDMRDFLGAKAISGTLEHDVQTRVLTFTKRDIDAGLSESTGLPQGRQAYYLERLRVLDGHPWILDLNYFLCDIVRGLTIEDAEQSVYGFLERTTGYRIIASRRVYAIRRATRRDRENLELDGCNCVGTILNNAFIDDGRLFEFTETHYSPQHFSFTQIVN